MDNKGDFKPSAEQMITDLRTQLPFIQVYPSITDLVKGTIRFHICCKSECEIPHKVNSVLKSSGKVVFKGVVELRPSEIGNSQIDRQYYKSKEITISEEKLMFLCNNVNGAQLELSDGQRQAVFHFHM
jgi:hypothetical protein